MPDTSNMTAMRIGLLIAGLVFLGYGLGYFLMPAFVWSIGEVTDYGAAGAHRWPGGWLIALGVGALLARGAPKAQKILFTTYSMGALLAAIGIAWYWATDYTGALWFAVLPIVLTLSFSAFFWWARGQTS